MIGKHGPSLRRPGRSASSSLCPPAPTPLAAKTCRSTPPISRCRSRSLQPATPPPWLPIPANPLGSKSAWARHVILGSFSFGELAVIGPFVFRIMGFGGVKAFPKP